ncbi:hypothetical protein [Shewanella holmiensis]|uniref:Uncharacterized protein n=1 Tax=Shewanella holmiensis TaxID=2952222 RepID=A0A9X3ATH8_9GAMM|nr:hypothetical protein [Shewanella holmiensis]MCT7940249.1 hypothetical protein [Shewanella holmiensis]
MTSPILVDIPFEKRHTCWFCDEPCNAELAYWRMAHTPHPSLTVPTCNECLLLAKKQLLTSIWECREAVKDQLMQRYSQDLAIGINWTEQELEESEFECKIFGGFKKSAWMMYQIAQKRINAPGWVLSIDGEQFDEDPLFAGSNTLGFEFDGLQFNNLTQAIKHYSAVLALDQAFLQQLVTLLGKDKFAHAVKLARLNIGITKSMQQKILNELIEDLDI